MNKLTAEVARRDIGHLKSFQSDPKVGLSLKEEKYLKALEIALPVLEQQSGWKLVPIELTDEMLRGIVPNMAKCEPLSHDEYDYNLRNERFLRWVWSRLLDTCPAHPTTDTYRQIENDGWIEWKAGYMPESVRGDRVQVRYASGETETDYSGVFNWGYGAGDLVVAYRVIENDGREE